ncbi:TetR/AcrR family transcriptional regulator [Streptomyces albidochromogenes]|uniref:TetR/AcrR family transcriptional regulator n=1 Tax=Streptomyces albidochromogenes TaxID=329524 RepID=A0ABW6FHK9_9ACTN
MSEPNTGLRSRLVDVGVELVTAEGVQALSLREIARRAGVSHGAPRRYFPTHLELLSAIARRGFEELAVQGAAALGDGTASPREQIATLGRVYLDFALTHRGMHELIFRHDLLRSDGLGLRDASLPIFSLLVDLVGRARPDADAPLVAGALLANLYGIAQLWTWGSLQLTTGADSVVPLLDTALEAHLGREWE